MQNFGPKKEAGSGTYIMEKTEKHSLDRIDIFKLEGKVEKERKSGKRVSENDINR